jgi:hypothetical protein
MLRFYSKTVWAARSCYANLGPHSTAITPNFSNLTCCSQPFQRSVTLSDAQWKQASLSGRTGDLGIQRISLLASSAVLLLRQLHNHFRLSSSRDARSKRMISVSHSIIGTYLSVHRKPSVLKIMRKDCSTQSPLILAVYCSTPKMSRVTRPELMRQLLVVEVTGFRQHQLITSCGLRLTLEAERDTVGLRLGTELCQTLHCTCGAEIDSRGWFALMPA